MAAGFECEFIEKPPKAFQSECPICLLVLREPYQATCCGKSFCKECIYRIKAANQACPTCNDKEFTLFPNKGLQQSLYDFKVYCTHKSKGCEWTGELRELDKHLNSDPPADKSLQGCLYTLIKCPLGCVGCEKGVCRKDLKSHLNDKLLSHIMIQSGQIKDISAKLATLPQLEAGFVQRMTKLEVVFEQRMIKLENKVSELDRMVASKPQPFGQSQQPDGYVTGTYKPVGAEFTMTNFDEYKRDNDHWYSPHFYTHPNGYKMCLGVGANGAGSGRGSHISVVVHLLQGEFDDQLKWPFQGNVSVKLVNQEEDRDHVIRTLHFGKASSQYCKRVMTKERVEEGWGFTEFLHHANLQPKYLKNDCIKLCIKKVDFY
jgi:TNF receptor-associated factor 4